MDLLEEIKNLTRARPTMQVIEAFDFNVHLTIDGTFKDYKRNMPSSLGVWKTSKYFNMIGANICGVSGIGDYQPKRYLDLVKDCGPGYFASVPWTFDIDADTNFFSENPIVRILKLHPRSLGDAIFNFDYEKIIEILK